jgi:phenylacetate-CoA ligase
MKSIKKAIVKFRLLIKGNSLRYLKQLKQAQWLDSSKTNALQKKRLADLLLHAYQRVPYYRDLFEKTGVIGNSGIPDLYRFNQIPFLTKHILRSRFEDLKSDDLSTRKWRLNRSGGSTGEPVKFIQDMQYWDWRDAVKMLYDIWTGYTFGEAKFLLWGSERDLFAGRGSIKTQIHRWLENNIFFNAYRMTPEQLHSCVEKINISKPIQILAYAESISDVCNFIKQKGLCVHSPRAIMTSAGTLLSPWRKTIESTFQTHVFDRYGSREVGDMACECDHHEGLHVSALTHYLEILTPKGHPANPGDLGEIVVTPLTNYAMPLIRYRIGDMGVWADSPCTCGRNWPLLKKVAGRVADTFKKRDGTLLTSGPFNELFHAYDWIERYQIIQEDYDVIRILFVPVNRDARLRSDHKLELMKITNKIRLVMGSKCEVVFEFVEDIPPSVSGKHRFTISKVVK